MPHTLRQAQCDIAHWSVRTCQRPWEGIIREKYFDKTTLIPFINLFYVKE